jgi:dethiobiotin synthetase
MTRPPGYFVAGTDTGIGKTVVTASLVAALRTRGLPAVPLKPVQTGVQPDAPGDLDVALQAAGIRADPALRSILNPYAFPMAASPHLAARSAGTRVRLQLLNTACQEVRMRDLLPVVEGVGGLLVPLNDEDDVLDLAALLALPVILVARAGLGTLNHTRLSVAALRQHHLPLAAVVLNPGLLPWDDIAQDNLDTLRRCLGPTPVLRFPSVRVEDADAVAAAGAGLLDAMAI